MSTTIDQRVVEMRFDNKHFEQNVATTMSTLDKLKQKLHLPGAVKGLDDVSKAAKKVDLSEIGNSADKVGLKFNAMYTIADQALRNITNSAMVAGRKIVSALTIDPVKTGFKEYETQMNAVQTILANTQSKGSTLDDVNTALETLNKYADQTIYNFTEMTRNIGTFTAAGVDLQTSVDSIKGIANLAAVSGSTSQQASTAMYQLSQALAAGRVSLMDWNSVVNAGMGGELFQNALLRTSELLKTGGREAVKTYGSFRESLTKGQWLTTDVLTETLKQLSGAYSKAELIEQGFTEEQADEIAKLAQTATDAATKVKTFTQLWDVMKEAAQSGWAQSWKIIVGDFEEAKALLTPLADFFTGIIGKISDARNKLLEGALGKGFGKLADKISSVTKPLKDTDKIIKKTTKTLKKYGDLVDEIIRGSWGNGEERVTKLTKAGYDYAYAQNLVNEKLGVGVRHSTDYKETQDELTEVQGELTKADAKLIDELSKMSDEQLENLGYTNEQVEALRELQKQADKTGIPLKEFIENIDEINGRYLLINSFKNIGQGIVETIKAISGAFRDIFPPVTAEQLYNVIAGFHKLSTNFVMSEGTADKLRKTFRGLFAALDIVFTLVGGPLKVAFKLLAKILGAADIDILSLTANIGDVIVRFDKWIDKVLDFNNIFKTIEDGIKKAIDIFKKWIDELKTSENIPLTIFEGFVDAGKNMILGLYNGLKNGIGTVIDFIVNFGKNIITKFCDVLGIESPSVVFFEIGKNIILGLFNGLKAAFTAVFNFFSNIWNTIVNTTVRGGDVPKAVLITIGKSILGVANTIANAFGKVVDVILGFVENLTGLELPSFREFIEIGKSAISNLVYGITVDSAKVLEVFSNLWENIKEFFSSLDFSKVSSVFWTISSIFTKLPILNTIAALANQFAAFGGDTVKGFINGIKDNLGSVGTAIWEFATSIITKFCDILGIESPSKKFFEFGKYIVLGLYNGIKELSIIVFNIVKETGLKLVDIIKDLDLGTIISGIVTVGMTIGFLKIASFLSSVGDAMDGFGDICESIHDAIGRVSKAISTKIRADAFKSFAIAVAILAGSLFVLTKLDALDLLGTAAIIAGLIGTITGFSILLDKFGPKDAKQFGIIALSIVGMSVAFGIIAKAIGKLSGVTIDKSVIITLGVTIAALGATLVLFGKFANPQNLTDIAKASAALIAMAGAANIISRLISSLKDVELTQDQRYNIIETIGGIGLIMAGMIAMTKLSGGSLERLGGTLLVMTACIAIIALICSKLKDVSLTKEQIDNLKVNFGGLLVALMVMMVSTNLFSKDIAKVGGALLGIAAAIGIIAYVCSKLKDVQLTTEQVLKIGGCLAGILLIIAGMIAVAKMAGGDLPKISKALLSIAIAIGLIGGIAAVLGMIDYMQLIKGIAAVTVILGMLALLMSQANKMQKTMGGIIALTACIAVIIGGIALLTMLDQNEIVNAGIVLAGIMTVMAITMAIIADTVKAQGVASSASKAILSMTACIAIIAGALYLISMQPWQQSLASAASLSIVLGVITGVLMILGKQASTIQQAENGIWSLSKMMIPLAAIALVLVGMSYAKNALANSQILALFMAEMIGFMAILGAAKSIFDNALPNIWKLTAMAVPLAAFASVLFGMNYVKDALANSQILALFMTEMIVLLTSLSLLQPLASKALIGVIALTTMAVPLLAFVGVLCLMKNVQNATENAIALSVLAGALSIMLIPLSLVGVLMASTGGMAALGIVALLAMAVPLVAFVGVLALMQNIKNATENVNLLTGLLNTLTKTLVILAIVGPLATVGVSAMSGLTLLIGAIGVMVTAVGALMEKFPALEEFLDKGIVILEKLAHAIGSVIGNIIDGFMTAATENLPLIGMRLSEFMTNLTPFLNGVKAMDEGVGSKIASLVGAILALTAADLITGIVNFISGGGSSLAQLGTNLSQFMINAMPFIAGAAMLNEDLLAGVKNLASIVTTLTANSILEGLASWLTGESSLASFGAQLGALGTNLAAFVTNLGTFSEDQVMTVDCAGRAIKALATAASEIPNEGGWVSKIVGENSLSAFGSELGTLGTNLRNFVVNLGTFTDAQVTTVDCAGKALKALASAADSIPNEGGWAAKICGDNSLATFGDKLPGLGSDISGFVKNLGTFGEDKISTVESACEAMTTITKLGKLDLKSLSNNVESLGGKLTDFGGKLKEFCSSMSDISSEGLSDAILKVSRIVALIKKISELNLNSVSNFGKDLKKIAKEGIKGFVDELSGDDPLEKVKDAADKIIKAYIKAVKKTKSDVKKAFKTVASEGVKGAEDKGVYGDFKDAGKYMVEGFAEGITANDFKAEAAAKAMAKAAKKAAEKALGIESPSKEMAKDGKYTVLGFVKGISDNLREIFKMGSEMGVEFKDGLEDSLDINSPSKETSKDGKFAVDGFVDTIKDHFKTAFESGFDFGEMFKAGIDASMLNQIQVDPKLTASYDDAVDSSINSAKNFKSSSDQIAALKELKNIFANDTKAIEKINSELFGIQEKDISDLKSFDKLTTKAELQMYKDLQKEYSSDSEQGKSIAKKIYDLEKSNDDKIIEDMKSSGKTGLAGELAYYRDRRNKYLENPAYLETIDKKIADLEKDLSEKTATYLKESEERTKEYSNRRLELEAEYDEKCKENAENRKAEIAEIEQKYTDAHAQRVSQLKDYRGLFEAVDEKEKVNASDILKNQKDQIDEMMEYSYNFESLAGRITNKDLLKELQEMGPEAAAYIQALNEMSDSQLSKFVSNYETKNEYANRMATNDLTGLRAEIDAEKAAADSIWDKEFGKIHGEYYGMYAINEDGTLSYKPGAFENLEKEQNEAMTDLKNSFLESIGAAGPEMETEFEKLSDNLVAKLADKEQWNKTGEQVIDGIDAGLKNKEGTLYATVTGIAAQMIAAMQSALAIHSPSRKFAEIGKYIDLGLASGMTNYANVVKTSALSLSDSAINTVQSSVSRIMDIVNSGVEIRPTISPVMSPSSINLGNVADVFNGKSSPRVLAEVGEISYMFNKRSQNGTNDDIVSAIDKLHGDMGKFGNNTYNINGVTYDDGTNISEAVETLVRAARVERRR